MSKLPNTLTILHLLAVPNTSTQCPDFPYTPLVMAAISAANTLLLLISIVTFIASCAVLKRAKRSRQVHRVPDYETAGNVVKVEGKAIPCPVYGDVDAVSFPIQPNYQGLQMHSLENHLYAMVIATQLQE